MVSEIYVAVAFIPRTAISVMLEDNVLVLYATFYTREQNYFLRVKKVIVTTRQWRPINWLEVIFLPWLMPSWKSN